MRSHSNEKLWITFNELFLIAGKSFHITLKHNGKSFHANSLLESGNLSKPSMLINYSLLWLFKKNLKISIQAPRKWNFSQIAAQTKKASIRKATLLSMHRSRFKVNCRAQSFMLLLIIHFPMIYEFSFLRPISPPESGIEMSSHRKFHYFTSKGKFLN